MRRFMPSLRARSRSSDLRPQELNEYLDRVTFVPVTPHTVRSKSRLKKELHQVKATGFAYSREEFTLGITAIATAVRSGAKLHGAINLAVPTARFTPKPRRRVS